MRIDIAAISDGPVLSGAVNGRAAFVALLKLIDREPSIPTPLFLDFRNVEVATGSFVRESVFAIKSHMRTVGSKYYPVVANVNESTYDEFALVADAKNDPIICCCLDEFGSVSEPNLIGHLDPKQQMTFNLVNELKATDANQLMERFGESEQTKSTTAWNNRLSSLASRGIIREFTQGRSKFYRPLFEEVR